MSLVSEVAQACRACDTQETAYWSACRGNLPLFCTRGLKDPTGKPLIWGLLHERMWKHLFWCRVNGMNCGMMVPRDSGKTTVFVLAWVLMAIGDNPNLRVKILSSSEGPARDRVETMLRILKESPEYRKVYPTVELATGEMERGDTFTLKRDSPSIDATVESWGVHTKALGGSCDMLVMDDVVDSNERESYADRAGTRRAVFHKWVPMARAHSFTLGLGTPWSEGDQEDTQDALVAYCLRATTSTLRIAVRRDFTGYHVWKDGVTEPDIGFDAFRTREDRERKYREAGHTSAQLALFLDARRTAAGPFDPDKFTYFDLTEEDRKKLVFVLFIDPAGGQESTRQSHADTDYAAIVVGAMNSALGSVDIVDVWMDNKPLPTAQAKKVVEIADKWECPIAWIEEVICKNWGRQEIERHMGQRRFTAKGVPVDTNKKARILRLDGPISRGELRFERTLLTRCPLLFAQFQAFSMVSTEHDDGPDAVEQLERHVRRYGRGGGVSLLGTVPAQRSEQAAGKKDDGWF